MRSNADPANAGEEGLCKIYYTIQSFALLCVIA